jgi:hypothetical protein
MNKIPKLKGYCFTVYQVLAMLEEYDFTRPDIFIALPTDPKCSSTRLTAMKMNACSETWLTDSWQGACATCEASLMHRSAWEKRYYRSRRRQLEWLLQNLHLRDIRPQTVISLWLTAVRHCQVLFWEQYQPQQFEAKIVQVRCNAKDFTCHLLVSRHHYQEFHNWWRDTELTRRWLTGKFESHH